MLQSDWHKQQHDFDIVTTVSKQLCLFLLLKFHDVVDDSGFYDLSVSM